MGYGRKVPPYLKERSPYPKERSPYPKERSPYPKERSPLSKRKTLYPKERSLIQETRINALCFIMLCFPAKLYFRNHLITNGCVLVALNYVPHCAAHIS
eukprot:sb/3478620/